jgi:hypothetical protein
VEQDRNKMSFLLESLEMLEARTGTTFPEGFDSKVEVMRLTLDPVNVSKKSDLTLGETSSSHIICSLKSYKLVVQRGRLSLPGNGLLSRRRDRISRKDTQRLDA